MVQMNTNTNNKNNIDMVRTPDRASKCVKEMDPVADSTKAVAGEGKDSFFSLQDGSNVPLTFKRLTVIVYQAVQCRCRQWQGA